MSKGYLIVGAIAAAVLLLVAKKIGNAKPKTVGGAPVSGQAALLATLANTQVTLANGAVLDTGNGVIFDPITGQYTNVYTGAVIY